MSGGAAGLPTGEKTFARWRACAAVLRVAGIVVGNPLHLSGESSPRAAKTQAFAAELGELTGLPIHFCDERLTTHAAHEILYEAGHERQKHGKVVDQVAATLILQSFLDERKAHREMDK